jgi:hypothetical protein
MRRERVDRGPVDTRHDQSPLKTTAFAVAIAEKPAGRFMIRSWTRVVKRGGLAPVFLVASAYPLIDMPLALRGKRRLYRRRALQG